MQPSSISQIRSILAEFCAACSGLVSAGTCWSAPLASSEPEHSDGAAATASEAEVAPAEPQVDARGSLPAAADPGSVNPPEVSTPAKPPPTAAFPDEPLPTSSASAQPSLVAAKVSTGPATQRATESHSETPYATPVPRPMEQRTPGEGSDSGGVLGPVRLGPMVGVGMPNLLNFGVLLKITSYFGAGVNVGLIPTVRLSYYGDATLKYEEFDAFLRVHPFAGGFFLGAGIGYATISGTVTDQFNTSAYAAQIPAGLSIPAQVTYSSQGSVRTLVLTPQIGYFYTTKVGFSIGLDFGAQLPIAPSRVRFESQLPLPSGTPSALVEAVQSRLLDPTDQKVRSTLESIGRTPIPTVNVRIGWLL